MGPVLGPRQAVCSKGKAGLWCKQSSGHMGESVSDLTPLLGFDL